ncbi:MAG: HEAT repeat domain-containing protein [Bacteroidota bacterium]
MRHLLIAATALALSAGPLTTTAAAQAHPPLTSPTWQANVGAQYAALLDSDSERVRADALGHIQLLARQQPDADLADTIEPLLALYETDRNDALRMAAVAALHALGDSAGMERLAELAQNEPSPTVRRVTNAALRDHSAALSQREARALTYRVR